MDRFQVSARTIFCTTKSFMVYAAGAAICTLVLIVFFLSSSSQPKPNKNVVAVKFGKQCRIEPCTVGFGEFCLKHEDCSGNLECIETSGTRKKCKCSRAEHHKYVPAAGGDSHCVALEGAPCNPHGIKENKHYPCIERSECVSINNQTHRCECLKQYVANAERECNNVGLGHPCDDSLPCDGSPDVVCIDDRCECLHEEQVFEVGRRKCSIPVGISCATTEQCVELAYCKNKDGMESSGNGTKYTGGRCTCLDYAIVDSENFKICIHKVSQFYGW